MITRNRLMTCFIVLFLLCGLFPNTALAENPLPNHPYIFEKALGQPDKKNTMINRISPSSAFHVGGVHVDRDSTPNRIYVADSGNNRILCFNGWKDFFEPGNEADRVIGQLSLWDSGAANGNNTQRPAPTASTIAFQPFPVSSTLESPRSIHMATDADNNLYVADLGNNRVLRFPDPFAIPQGEPQVADLVWGQADFESFESADPPTASSLLFEWYQGHVFSGGVDVDGNGNVWIADTGNSRVLRFPAGSNEAEADLVLGQPDFTTRRYDNTYEVSKWDKDMDKMFKPLSVRVQSTTGDVYVLEGERPRLNRIMVFEPPFTNGMEASRIVGEAGRLHITDWLTPDEFSTQPPADPSEWSRENYPDVGDRHVRRPSGIYWARGFGFDPTNDDMLWLGDNNKRIMQIHMLPNGDWEWADVIGYGSGVFDRSSPWGHETHYILPDDFNNVPPINGIHGYIIQPDGEIGFYNDGSNDYLLFGCATNRSFDAYGVSRIQLPIQRQGIPPNDFVICDSTMCSPFWNDYSGRTMQNTYGMSCSGSQVYVSDGERILVWEDIHSAGTFAHADYVIGKDDFETNYEFSGIIAAGGGVGTQTTGHHIGSGNDYMFAVHDRNRKIVIFELPITGSMNDPGDIVKTLNQTNVVWADDSQPVSFQAWGLVYDEVNDALWVSDIEKNRILRISDPLGAARVDMVIGQANKTDGDDNAGSGWENPNRHGFAVPWNLSLDNFNNLYIVDSGFEGRVDSGNLRVVRYDAATIVPEPGNIFPLPDADGVFCEPDFESRGTYVEHRPNVPTWVCFDQNNHMILLVDAYWNEPYERVWYYETPHMGETPQPGYILNLAFGQAATAWFMDAAENQLDAKQHLILQDHTWNRILYVDYNEPTPGVEITETEGSTWVNGVWPEYWPTGETKDTEEARRKFHDDYTVALQSAPSADVEITVTIKTNSWAMDLYANNDYFNLGDRVVLTFTAENWDAPQTIHVVSLDAPIIGPISPSPVMIDKSGISSDSCISEYLCLITHSATSSDPDYNKLEISDVDATVIFLSYSPWPDPTAQGTRR